METIPKLVNALSRHDVTDISEATLLTLREKFTKAISQDSSTARIAALENLIAECAAPLEALEEGVELSLEYELFLTSLLRILMLESAREKLDHVLVSA